MQRDLFVGDKKIKVKRDAQLLKIKFEPSHQIEWQDETIGC